MSTWYKLNVPTVGCSAATFSFTNSSVLLPFFLFFSSLHRSFPHGNSSSSMSIFCCVWYALEGSMKPCVCSSTRICRHIVYQPSEEKKNISLRQVQRLLLNRVVLHAPAPFQFHSIGICFVGFSLNAHFFLLIVTKIQLDLAEINWENIFLSCIENIRIGMCEHAFEIGNGEFCDKNSTNENLPIGIECK